MRTRRYDRGHRWAIPPLAVACFCLAATVATAATPPSPGTAWQWSAKRVNADKLAASEGGATVSVVLIDTGVDVRHAAFRGEVTGDGPAGYGHCRHGTLVAGILASARAAAGIGALADVGGKVKVGSVSVGGCGFPTTSLSGTDAVIRAVRQGANVINFAWDLANPRPYGYDHQFECAFRYAALPPGAPLGDVVDPTGRRASCRDLIAQRLRHLRYADAPDPRGHGVLVVAAAGNRNLRFPGRLRHQHSYPCEFKSPHDGTDLVLCVGNSTVSSPAGAAKGDAAVRDVRYAGSLCGPGQRNCWQHVIGACEGAGGSNYGPEVDIAAPGTCVRTTEKGGRYATVTGTSVSVPYVAAAAAVVWSRNPAWTAQRVRERLIATADHDAGTVQGEIGPLLDLRTATHPLAPLDDADPTAADRVVPASAPGTYAGITARARHADPRDRVSYALLTTAGGAFTIDAASGRILVAEREALRAGAAELVVEARATDGLSQRGAFVVRVE